MTRIKNHNRNFNVQENFDNPHRRIVNFLLLNASFADNPGLLNGKMGIAVFFYHYARYTGNKIFEDFAGELIEQVLKEIHINSSVDFSSGLAGIGWGVEYLIKNGFAEAVDENILDELDNSIFQLDRKNPRLKRVYNDFYGYGLYYLCRAKTDIWNEEALQLIWDDLKVFLNEVLPVEVKLSPDYIISLLYCIQEIQKQPFCPSGVDEMITAIPGFVSKNLNENINIIEYQYIKLLFHNLGIISFTLPKPKAKKLTIEKLVDLCGQEILYSIVFQNLQYKFSSTSNYINELASFKPENLWGKITGILNKKNTILQTCLLGYTLSFLKTYSIPSKMPLVQLASSDAIYIFIRKGRASEYGIGTYIKELTSGLKNQEINIVVVCLDADKTEFTIEEQGEIKYWYIPLGKNSTSICYDFYYKTVVSLLRVSIKNTNKMIFHLNSMHDYQLAVYLREVFECKILLVVHYMDWSFALKGDLSRMRKIISQPKEKITNPLEKSALNYFEEDRKLLKNVDHIVCLADYARDILCMDYGIESEKITVINNGLEDRAKPLTSIERSGLKEKYRINPDEKIILYAGRLDEIKGISYLIKAFKKVLEYVPDCRLWIIGDGAYNPLFKEAEGIWNKICFTGRISQEYLFELYSIADVGVIPSLFEPFGYVAAEMMMHSLPIVVTATTGLDEIVEDGISGLKVQVIVNDNNNEVDISMMAQKNQDITAKSGRKRKVRTKWA